MYVIFFGVGAGFIIISLIMGELLEVEGTSFAFFKPSLIAVFLTVTGGVGMLLVPRLGEWFGAYIILSISASIGFIIAGIINRFILMPLYKAQNTSAFDKQATIGAAAKVISPIPHGGYGKIQFNISGSVVTSPAKSEDGGAIANGEQVDIIYIEKNAYFVRKKQDDALPFQQGN